MWTSGSASPPPSCRHSSTPGTRECVQDTQLLVETKKNFKRRCLCVQVPPKAATRCFFRLCLLWMYFLPTSYTAYCRLHVCTCVPVLDVLHDNRAEWPCFLALNVIMYWPPRDDAGHCSTHVWVLISSLPSPPSSVFLVCPMKNIPLVVSRQGDQYKHTPLQTDGEVHVTMCIHYM